MARQKTNPIRTAHFEPCQVVAAEAGSQVGGGEAIGSVDVDMLSRNGRLDLPGHAIETEA